MAKEADSSRASREVEARMRGGRALGLRSRTLPCVLLALLVGIGLPLHLCMPLWCDNTFYDVSAGILLRGELLYREVFYYVLPGMALLQAGLRALVGWGSEALRGLDFLIALGVVFLLSFRILPAPRGHAVRVWGALLLLFFYLGTSELCHCQPDTWMLLPALLALGLRIRQASDLVEPDTDAGRLARRSLLEGVCWGLGATIKPVVLLPGLACLLATAVRTGRTGGGAWGRRLAVDAGGLLVGGLLVGLPLAGWLVASGNWPHFWADVTSGWLGDYRAVSAGWLARSRWALSRLSPWGFTHLAALPLAVALARGALAPAAGARGVSSPPRLVLGLLALCYLTWFVTAHFVQYPLDYHALPPILLALTLLLGYTRIATRRRLWAVAIVVLALSAVPGHPLLRPSRLALWPRCWTEGASASLRDALALERRSNVAASHVDLEQVADYLRRQAVEDREVTCYSLSSLSLYTTLDLLPSSRFVQLWTIMAIAPHRRDEILRSVLSGPQRFVVVDLRDPPVRMDPGHRTVWLLPQVLGDFPYREEVVFRSGRYLVHRVRRPGDPPFERPPGPLRIPPSIPEGGPGI